MLAAPMMAEDAVPMGKYDKSKSARKTNKPKGARGYSSSSSDKSIVSSSSGENSKLASKKSSSSLSHHSQTSDTSSYEVLELTPKATRKPTKTKKTTSAPASSLSNNQNDNNSNNAKQHSGTSSTRSTTGGKLSAPNSKIVSGNYVVHDPGNSSTSKGNLSKPEKKRRSSHRHSPETSNRSIQTVLSKDLLLFVFSFLNSREISSLAITCRFFQCLIDRYLDKFGEVGTFIKIEARHSLFFRFDTLIEELLTEFPSIVIHCEIGEPRDDDSSNSEWHDSTFVNSERFELQSLTPQTRAYEKTRLKNHIKTLVRHESKEPQPFDISTQSWFLDLDRKQVEQILERQAEYTFCIRSSSVARSYVLSYKNNGKPFHSLIVPWKKWFFSGTISDDFIVHGLFFTSVAYLVWYWRKMGLGHRWMPLNYRHS